MNSLKSVFSPLRLIFIFLSIACMVIIFMFSMEDSEESSDTSGTVTEIAVEICVPDYEELSRSRQDEIMEIAEHIVRKTAHFTIYAALGFCISCAVGKRRIFSAGTYLSAAVCFIYACTDEFHQYLVPGRSCKFTDVLIDTSGSLCGIIFSMLCIYVIMRIKAKSSL